VKTTRVEPDAPAAAPASAAKPTATVSAKGSFTVQLASLPSEAEAGRTRDVLKSKYPALIGSLDLEIRRADLGGHKGVRYRVVAGPFTAHDEAQRLCERLRAAPHPADCFILATTH